jgi:hypothetical protein
MNFISVPPYYQNAKQKVHPSPEISGDPTLLWSAANADGGNDGRVVMNPAAFAMHRAGQRFG